MEKFNAYKQRALDVLAKPVGEECINRVKSHIDAAKQEYANVLLAEDIGTVRYDSGRAL